MKIGLAVSKFITNDIENNLKVIEKSIIEASNQNVDLVCFGEAVLQGFHSLNGDYQRDLKISVSMDSVEIQRLIKLAQIYQIGLAVGYLEKNDSNIYSSYLVIDKFGQIIINYRRVSPGWKVSQWNHHYQEGNEIKSFTFLGHTFKIALCGDLWDNEDTLISFQTDLLLWPVYIDSGYQEWVDGSAIKEYAIQASKVSQNAFLVNSMLDDQFNKSEGRACHFQNQEVKSTLGLGVEAILIIEI